jgi:uncharacterized protein
MRIGILGDTHRSSRNPRALPEALLDGLQGCDLIMHLGDVNAPWVLDVLAEIAPVRAVQGNNDEPQLLKCLPWEHFLQIGPHRIGMIHGHGTRYTARKTTLERMRGLVDCAVYGHSHRPEVVERDGLLLVNPGSPTQRRYAPEHTYAMMQVGDQIDAELVILE